MGNMRRNRVGWALCLAAVGIGAAQAGELAGRVSDARGELPMEGARLRLVELNRETVAARDGGYRFLDVPAGSWTLRAEYIGAPAMDTPVTVGEQGEVRADLRLGAAESVRLADVLVVGQAAAQSAALSQQRAASSIKTIASSDAIGKFPDQNAAESLQRLPGLSVARDQGEGRFVIIRGIDPALSSTTINGMRVPGPEADSRQVNLDVLASDLLESVEVSKSMTPDMDGDAVGGNIEIRSTTALDRGNSLSARVEGSYNDQVGETSPRLALSGTRLFDVGGERGKLGMAGALSWYKRDFGSDNVEAAGWPEIEGPEGDVRGLEEAEQRDYRITRERLSAALNFDYAASPALDLYWRTLYSDFSDDEVQTTNLFAYNTDEVVELGDSGGLFDDSEVEKLTEARKETQRILSTVLGAEQRLGLWTVDYRLGYSTAEEDTPDALGATFVGEGMRLGYSGAGSRTPRLFADDAAFADAATFGLDEIALESSRTKERETALGLDLKRALRFGEAPGFVKFGAKLRMRDKTGNVDAQVYDGFAEDFTLADFGSQRVEYPFGAWGPAASRGGVRRFFDERRADLELDEDGSTIDSRIEDYRMDEDILAGYAMASADIGRLRIAGGLRVERTDTSSRGTRLLVDEEAGSGDPEFSALSRDRTYTDLLPSLNFRWELSDRTILRAAWSQTIARPGFEASSPRQSIEITEDDGEFEREAELGNPDLDPLRSQNFDLAIEFYPGGVSALSAGLFYKRIRDFFVLADIAGEPGDFEDFNEAITTLNGGKARLIGLELAATHRFSRLPSPFDGFLVSANATFTDSEAELPQRSEKVPLPRQSDTLWNLALGYEKYGFDLRLSATYRDDYFDEVDELDDPETDRYVSDHLQIDFSGSYRVATNYEVYFNAVNLNDEPFHAYFRERRYLSQYEEYGPTFELGLKASF